MAILASTYRSEGRWKEAEGLGVKVVEKRKRVLGQEHPDTLASMASLAYTWKSHGRVELKPLRCWHRLSSLVLTYLAASTLITGVG